MGIVKYLRNTVPNIDGILTRRTSLPYREILMVYLKLRLIHVWHVKILGQKITSAKIFGFTVHFFDYSMFLFLFEEIFVKQEYYFVPDTPRPVILDCGSNIGLSVLYFKKLCPGAKIIAFEPDQATFALLKTNVDENGLDDVELHNAAVYDREGEITFYYDPAEPGSPRMSVASERTGAAGVTVKTVALSPFIQSGIRYLKMDIEGAETTVLNELAESHTLERIEEMTIEYHHHLRPDDDALSNILALLESRGFGYQLATSYQTPFCRGVFQDLLIYGYRKQPSS